MKQAEFFDLLKTKIENLNFKLECLQGDIQIIKQVISSDDFALSIKRISRAKIIPV